MLFVNDAKHLILGTGQLLIDGVDVGLLKGDVSFDHEPKEGTVKGGFPQVTVKSYKEEEEATLNASVAEISAANVTLLLGQLGGGGGDFPTLTNVKFIHERENDQKIEILMYKATATAGFKVKFTETGLALMDLSLKAIADETKPAGKSLYEITITDYSDPGVVAVTSISVPATETVTVGANKTLTATIAPENATSKKVYWGTSDATKATVSDGIVTGVGAGEAIITATCGGHTDTCVVTVS